jgi:hypothetical protein
MPGCPGTPYHHDGQLLPVDQAAALIEKVSVSAREYAGRALADLASDVSVEGGRG